MSKREGRTPRTAEEIEFNRKLGQRIEALRARARISQVVMAEKLGINPVRLYWYESGRTPLPPLILLRISQELDVKVDALMQQKLRKCCELLQIQKSLLSSSVDNLPA